jgi:hypothetical protein
LNLRSRRFTLALLFSLLLGTAAISTAAADTPPVPDFFFPYGKVQMGGANLNPTVQPVIAFVNGKACGDSQTLVAPAAPDTPPDDVGKTVYVVDVLANGAALGQRPNCGHPGDTVSLYFPVAHAIGNQTPSFQQGGQRVDLDLTTNLSHRLTTPQVAIDASN